MGEFLLTYDIDQLIKACVRIKNAEKALSLLHQAKNNALFDYNNHEYENKEIIKQYSDHVQELIFEAICLIETVKEHNE